jgi:hypothetical protein
MKTMSGTPRPTLLAPIRNLTWNIVHKNHGPATQVRGAPARETVNFLGATDLGTRSVLERISIQNHFFESESVLLVCNVAIRAGF